MAFREKLAWLQLGAIGSGFMIYAWMVQAIGSASNWAAPVYVIVGPLIAMAVLVALVAAAGATIFAVANPDDAQAGADERERTISRIASSRAYMFVTLGLAGAVSALLFGATTLLAAHILIGLFVLAEIVRYASEAWQYRREHG